MVELNYRPLSALALSARASKLPASANVHLWELPKRRMLTLRLDPTSTPELVTKVEEAMGGMALPTRPNTLTAYTNDSYVLWMSPDEFMIDIPHEGPGGQDRCGHPGHQGLIPSSVLVENDPVEQAEKPPPDHAIAAAIDVDRLSAFRLSGFSLRFVCRPGYSSISRMRSAGSARRSSIVSAPACSAISRAT